MPTDSVSVIVTAHNCASVLGRTLDSLEDALGVFTRQFTGTPAEAVIVDDASSDDTHRWTTCQPDRDQPVTARPGPAGSEAVLP
jgi:glycosyltransferase involved in cell wall biosynthesis